MAVGPLKRIKRKPDTHKSYLIKKIKLWSAVNKEFKSRRRQCAQEKKVKAGTGTVLNKAFPPTSDTKLEKINFIHIQLFRYKITPELLNWQRGRNFGVEPLKGRDAAI
jgi:hypothetical protein